jgi:alpha-glucoside transport system substrate-binding protein
VFYGAPFGASSKSLVWYSPAQFKKLGVTIPTTWAEMDAIAAKFKAAGANPWCAGIESGAATGWPATDWIEQMVLREVGPKKYNAWWQGQAQVLITRNSWCNEQSCELGLELKTRSVTLSL